MSCYFCYNGKHKLYPVYRLNVCCECFCKGLEFYYNQANNWRYLMIATSEGLDKKTILKHNRNTSKADLDKWLMSKFNLTQDEAREISNYSIVNLDYQVGKSGVKWIAKRDEPKFNQYPELKEYREKLRNEH